MPRHVHCVKWNQQLWRKEGEEIDQHLKVMQMHPRLCRQRMFVFFFEMANIKQVGSSPPAAVPDEHVASSSAHVSKHQLIRQMLSQLIVNCIGGCSQTQKYTFS